MGTNKKKTKGGNEIGFKQNVKNREEALGMLDTLTKKREAEGYIWVVRGTTFKQIHPSKAKAHLEDGWRKSKTGGEAK